MPKHPRRKVINDHENDNEEQRRDLPLGGSIATQQS